MGDEVHLWRIDAAERLVEIKREKLNLESRLHEWIKRDISILDPSLLVIGSEVPTAGGPLDLLCINEDGDLTVVELKRDKTPREITAQVLDYASWVVNLSNERITEIANDHLDGKFDEVFCKQFGVEPDALNSDHRLLVVGSQIDESSERIIRYLSDSHGVNINAATFQYFTLDDGTELLARVFLLEPSEVDLKTRTKGSSKRPPNLSYDELNALASEAGVRDLYDYAVNTFEPLLRKHRTRSSIGFERPIGGSRKTVISLLPGESNATEGLFYRIYKSRYAQLAGLSPDEVEKLMPARHEEWAYLPSVDPDQHGYEGYITDQQEIDRLATPLRIGHDSLRVDPQRR